MNKVFTIFITIIFLSLFLSGVQLAQEPVKIVPFDVVTIVFSMIGTFVLLSRLRIYITTDLVSFSLLVFLLLVWHLMHILVSTDIARAVTLLAILTRDVVMSVLIAAVICNNWVKESNISYSFLAISMIISFFSLVLFLAAVTDPGKIVVEPYPGLIYRGGEGLVPHLQGFSHNPIYFATLVLLSLIAGLLIDIPDKRYKIWVKMGLFIIFITLFMTFQRGPIIVFAIGMVVMGFIVLPFPSRRFFGKYARRFVYIAPIILFLIWTLRLPNYEFSLFQRILYRFQKAEWSMRLDRWSQMLSGEGDIPWLIGHGLREAEMFVGGAFVESSYVEILYDQGLVGFMLWIILFVYIIFLGISKLRKDGAILPWCWGWLLIVLSMGYISMHYDPLTWVVAGIIVGWRSTTLTFSAGSTNNNLECRNGGNPGLSGISQGRRMQDGH